ncbi:MAG: glycosyltransferase, partial [Acidobacteriota bacterium]|nr:glycosyltransferase [Acidobacteriota bacterium]
ESAACGTPVVAAAVGGLTTLVDDGRTGFLVEDGDPPAYAEAAEVVLGDTLLAERMSTAAVVRARRYTWAASASVLRATYEELAVGNLVECG